MDVILELLLDENISIKEFSYFYKLYGIEIPFGLHDDNLLLTEYSEGEAILVEYPLNQSIREKLQIVDTQKHHVIKVCKDFEEAKFDIRKSRYNKDTVLNSLKSKYYKPDENVYHMIWHYSLNDLEYLESFLSNPNVRLDSCYFGKLLRERQIIEKSKIIRNAGHILGDILINYPYICYCCKSVLQDFNIEDYKYLIRNLDHAFHNNSVLGTYHYGFEMFKETYYIIYTLITSLFMKDISLYIMKTMIF